MNLLTYLPLLFNGIGLTLAAWLAAGIISLSIGVVIGILSCRELGSRRCCTVVRIYTFIAKGIPAYVQILVAFFVIPGLFGVTIPALVASIGALAFCSSGYVTEIVRSGINAIPQGQWDAAYVLGYSTCATLLRVIMPQTLRNILAPLGGELEQLLKSTSLLATIGITELTRSGMNIISRELNPIPIYLMIAGVYLLFSGILQVFILLHEKRVEQW